MQRTDADRQRRQHLADVSTGHRPRLLPWTTDDGKRCMLSTGDEGCVSFGGTQPLDLPDDR